jgi:RNA polymerase sigma-70 factor (ECF subfamily)
MEKTNENSEVYPSTILTLDDDFALIRSFNEGNEAAFRTLINRHKEKVRNLIFLTLGSADMVDDISQEVFIIVYRKLKSFRFESQFTTWLYSVTLNKCRDHLRKVKIRQLFTPISHDDDKDIPFDGEEKGDFDIQEIVRAAVAKLPEKFRVAIIMRDFEGLSYQEIAEMLNSEVGTIKSRVFRGREALKHMLEPMREELL